MPESTKYVRTTDSVDVRTYLASRWSSTTLNPDATPLAARIGLRSTAGKVIVLVALTE